MLRGPRVSGTAQKCLWYALRRTPRSTRAPAQGTPPPSTAEQRPLRTNPRRPVPWSAAGARSSPCPGCCGERAMDAGQTPPWTAGETRSGRWGRRVAGRLHLHLSKELRAVSCGGCTHTNKCIKDGKQKARARRGRDEGPGPRRAQRWAVGGGGEAILLEDLKGIVEFREKTLERKER